MTDITEPFAHVPARGWTPELKARFLDRLAAHGNARAACRAVDLSAEAAYRLRRRDAFFARGWAAALVLARENGSGPGRTSHRRGGRTDLLSRGAGRHAQAL